mmetsp:Transcript_28708/g.37655  ORF Transcript_28708/g.37655 Transcript_28708/m.37655 type:complete len:571 (-) Transcript_28708:84-1796(-)
MVFKYFAMSIGAMAILLICLSEAEQAFSVASNDVRVSQDTKIFEKRIQSLSPKKVTSIIRGGALKKDKRYIKATKVQLSKLQSEKVEMKTQGTKLFFRVLGIDTLLIGLILTHAYLNSDEKGIGIVERAFYAVSSLLVMTITAANPDLVGNLRVKSSAFQADAHMSAFRSFQKKFLLVQLLATFIDFTQGAYLYKVYQSYGYEMKDTALLYLSGFVSSLLTGFTVGKLVDSYGRRKGCIVQLILNVLQCQLLRFKDLRLLFLGRILSGVCQSLSTSYECWMVSEHNSRKFSPQLIMDTFAKTALVLAGAAVLSGIVSGALVQRGFDLMTLFNISSVVSLACIFLVYTTWNENYGHSSGVESSIQAKNSMSFSSALKQILSNTKILCVGLTECMFGSAFMIFTFMWTPILLNLSQGTTTPLNLGLVFSTFMICIMVGSSFPQIASRGYFSFSMSPEVLFLGVIALGIGALLSLMLQQNLAAVLAAFLVFEIVFGSYIPLMGSIKARCVPEHIRATTSNVFKVVTNAIVIALLLGPLRSTTWTVEKKQFVVFGIGAIALGFGFASQLVSLNA